MKSLSIMEDKMCKTDPRRSGVELLRIFAVCGVILLHYNNPLIGKALQFAEGGNLLVLYVLEGLFCCAVDVFVLISGYFLCNNYRRSLSKPVSLLVMVIVVNLLFYTYSINAGNSTLSFESLINEVIPHNYFVTLYVALFFISPYINKIFVDFDKTQWRLFLIVGLVLFSIWPSITDVLNEVTQKEWFGISTIGAWGNQSGHNIVNFVLLYSIGAFVKLMKIDKKQVKSSTLLFIIGLCLVASFCWSWFSTHEVSSMGRSAWAYHNPITILISILMFLLFSRISIKSRTINESAKAAFACFLIHGHVITHLHIEEFVQRSIPVMLLHILVCMLVSYFVSYFFFIVYDLTIDRFIKKTIKQKIDY